MHKWRRRGAFFKYQKSSSCWIKYFFRFPSGLFFCCSRIRLKNKICAYANVCQFSSRHNPAPSPEAPLSSCHSLHHVWKVLSSLTELTQLRWKFRTFYLTKILSLARYVPKYGNVAALHWVSKEKSNIDSIKPKTHLEAYPADLARAGRKFLPGSHSPHPCSATSLTLPWRDTTLYLHP